MTRRPVLVLGIGNRLLGDDGVGVRAVEALADLALPDDVEVADGGTGGADLLEAIDGRRRVIVLDALRADAPPGTVVRLDGADLAASLPSLSVHEVGLAEALAMARALGCAPAEVVVLGVVPREISFRERLSPEVAAALPRLVDLARAEADRR